MVFFANCPTKGLYKELQKHCNVVSLFRPDNRGFLDATFSTHQEAARALNKMNGLWKKGDRPGVQAMWGNDNGRRHHDPRSDFIGSAIHNRMGGVPGHQARGPPQPTGNLTINVERPIDLRQNLRPKEARSQPAARVRQAQDLSGSQESQPARSQDESDGQDSDDLDRLDATRPGPGAHHARLPAQNFFPR